ncbi:MAG: S8 family serine peptidase [Pseudomonadota bacterium]
MSSIFARMARVIDKKNYVNGEPNITLLNSLSARSMIESEITETQNLIGSKKYSFRKLNVHEQSLIDSGDASNVQIIQVEHDIFDDHQDVDGNFNRVFENRHLNDFVYSYSCLKDAIHGTATSSIVISEEFGTAPNSEYFFTGRYKTMDQSGCPVKRETSSVQETLERLVEEVQRGERFHPGDIVTISLQSVTGPNGKLLPIDFDGRHFAALETLYEFGLIVFIAAGNSGVNLDTIQGDTSEVYPEEYKKRGKKSGAIKVGYSGIHWKNRCSSNHGSLVKFFAPTGSLRAACYNYSQKNRQTDLIEAFSPGFGKSSAATPVIASIAAKIQSAYKFAHGETNHLTSGQICKIMCNPKNSVKPINDGNDIGVFPIVSRCINEVLE